MGIRCENVSVDLGGRRIVEAIDIHVPSGGFIGIIGPNGSGKSTLLKSIYRVLQPTGGAIYVGGEALETLSYKASARRLAVVSQHNYYNFDFTVSEVVLMGRAPHKRQFDRDTAEDFEKVDAALEKVDMTGYKDRIFSTLSGGEQQRIILARALAQDTPCLVLDEPTNHLDIKHQLDIMTLVRTLGLTVVAAIHDLNMAAMYCDYVYVLKDGVICGEGAPDAVLTPETIREIYDVEASVMHDPVTGGRIIVYRAVTV